MDAGREELAQSFQETQPDLMLPLVATGSAVDPKVEQIIDTKVDQTSISSSKDEKATGTPNECTSTAQESREGGQQEEEAAFLDKGDVCSGLDRDDKKKEDEMTRVEQLGEMYKRNNEVDLKSVQGEMEKGNIEKQTEMGEGEHNMKEKVEEKAKKVKERNAKDVLTAEAVEKKGVKKGPKFEREEDNLKENKEGRSLLDADGKDEEQQQEEGVQNLEKVDKSKKEKKEKSDKKGTDTIGRPEAEKKKEKKRKVTSERIKKKLERINAKIGRILVKKDDYMLRLKEAQDKECQEAEKAALQERKASTGDRGISTNNESDSALRKDESVILDEFRLHRESGTVEASDKQVERGSSGSLSRTESLVEGVAHFIKEQTGQKELEEDPPNVLKCSCIEGNHCSQMEDSETTAKGNEGVINCIM